MYEHFTNQAREALTRASEEAQRYKHQYIGTEHILLALAAPVSGVAADMLKTLDVSLERVRKEVDATCGAGRDYWLSKLKLPETPRAMKVMAYAIEEARRLGHDYIGTEHLLLGLLRDEETVAAKVLLNLGVHLDQSREALASSLGLSLNQVTSPQPAERAAPQRWFAPICDYPEAIKPALQQLDETIERLTLDMEEAVAAMDFHEAARLRDEALKLKQRRKTTLSEWVLAHPPAPSWLSWQDGRIAALARMIRDEEAWDHLAALADCLAAAGCTHAEVLGHCQQGANHRYRYCRCWVVDWLLGEL